MITEFHYNSSGGVFRNANELRRNQTPAEKHLWKLLRDRKLFEYKFRRQHPIGPYIVDFYCFQVNLAIEVDGEIHNSKERQILDAERTKFIEAQGIKVIRFTNDEVLRSTGNVLDRIASHLIIKE